jgi:outer membrane protein assembly factor BamE
LQTKSFSMIAHGLSRAGRAFVVCACAVICGCAKVPMLPGVTPHRIEIQQGNVITQDMVAKLKPGMTRHQVRFVLGTPPIVDPFRTDRWDYVYYLASGGKFAEHRRITLIFSGESLVRIEGDVTPRAPASGKEAAAEKAAATTTDDALRVQERQVQPNPGKPAGP